MDDGARLQVDTAGQIDSEKVVFDLLYNPLWNDTSSEHQGWPSPSRREGVWSFYLWQNGTT